jgi:hypothetical protein
MQIADRFYSKTLKNNTSKSDQQMPYQVFEFMQYVISKAFREYEYRR